MRGYARIRNGRRESVRAHQRSDPPGGEGEERGGDGPRLVRYSPSTEEEVRVWLAMAKRPDPFDLRGRQPILEGPIGGGGAARGSSRAPQQVPSQPSAPQQPAPPVARPGQPPMPPAEAARLRQELRDIVAPSGVPIGTTRKGSRSDIRGLPGGDAAAQRLFDDLTRGRGGMDATPPWHTGRSILLPDGSRISYRPTSGSNTPAVDINIPGFPDIKRIHFK